MPRMGGWRIGGDLVDPEVPLEDRKQLAELLSNTVSRLQDELRTLTGAEVSVQTDADIVLHGDAVPADLSNAKLHRDLVSADLHVPKGHSTSHEQAQSDALSVGAPSRVGVANSSGVSTIYCRRDHNHALLETGGQELTLGAISDGQVLTRSGSDIVGATGASVAQFVDHVYNWGSVDVDGAGEVDITRAALVIDDVLVRFLFAGTGRYPAGTLDDFFVAGMSVGGDTTIELVGSAVHSTITIPNAGAPAIHVGSAVASLPAGKTEFVIRVTVPTTTTLTLTALCWDRYKT